MSPCFTRGFGFDGGGLKFTRVSTCFSKGFGFDGGEGFIQGGATPVFYEDFWILLRRGLNPGGATPVFYEGFGICLQRGLNPGGDDLCVLRGFLDLTAARG